MDGISPTPRNAADPFAPTLRRADIGKLSKSAEEYVALENRLAAQREKPPADSQFTSIFDQLRNRLPR